MQRNARAAIAALALALHATDAATCPAGVTAPDVITLMASKQNPEKEAWIVAPDCTYTTKYLVASRFYDASLELRSDTIQHVASVPSGTKNLELFSELVSADLSSAVNLKAIYLAGFDARLIHNLKLPNGLDNIRLFQIDAQSVGSAATFTVPNSVSILSFLSLGISSLKSISSSLRILELQENEFTSINFPLPPKLEQITLSNNPITTMDRIKFPSTLKAIECNDCPIETIRGINWSKITFLSLKGNAIREFEVRQSDFDHLDALSSIDLRGTNQFVCSDPDAIVKYSHDLDFCVISDQRFEELYGGGSTTKSPSTGSSESESLSPSGSGDSSATSDESDRSSNSNNRTSSTAGDGGSSRVGSDGQPLDDENNSSYRNGGGGTKISKETNAGATSSSSSSVITSIFIAVSCVFGFLLAVVGYRLYRASKRNRDREGETPGNTLMPFDTPVFSSSQDPSSSSGGNGGGASTAQEYLSNDIRNDKAILPFRIDPKDISLSKQIARGGFGVIFRGVYGGRAVAVKQMLPDAWRNETQLMDFMDEIRLCASLSHPKIVEFIGVAWVSLRDISVIIEFMAGGDLHAVLHKHARAQSLSSSTTSFTSAVIGSSSSMTLSDSTSFVPSPREWSDRWTTASMNSKTLIAKDVAEAVVYLHSFPNPIIHRDLKARNVLLDSHGNAKLSDFGISRKMTVDETMTSEVGTSAWIAPEVLRGDRYSERADIYSFGVLLVEMDKCRHPYAGEGSLGLMGGSVHRGTIAFAGKPPNPRDSHSQAMHQNMQIAMLVSAGRLRPMPSVSCPARVQALISRCLSFAPDDRPSAMEVSHELRHMLADTGRR